MKGNTRRQHCCGGYVSQVLSAGGIPMNEIGREELKEKLDKGENVKLAFVLGDWQYRAMHIPGSLNLPEPEEALKTLDPGDEVIVYCSNPACRASISAYYFLVERGYKKVRRYTGGLVDWQEAGYPLEGERVAA